MPVTFSLPTVLARLADGQATIQSTDFRGSRPGFGTRPAGRIRS